MKQTLFFSTIIVIILCSCGLSQEELAIQQKHRDDSIAAITAQKIIRRNEINTEFNSLKSQLNNTKADLAAAKDKLNGIKEFHFLRTTDEREKQVKSQTLHISKLQDRFEVLSNDISVLEQELSQL